MNSTIHPRLWSAAACRRFSFCLIPFTLSAEGPPSSPPNLRVRCLPRPGRGVSALDSSFLFGSRLRRERTTSGMLSDVKSLRINTYKFTRFGGDLRPFRINTYKSVSKQRALSTFRINTYEKQGEGGPVMVNQTPDEGCLSRATIGSRETSPTSAKEIYPEEHRGDRRFRPCRKGPLFKSDKDFWLTFSLAGACKPALASLFRFPFNFQSKIPTLAETFRQLVSNLPYTLPSSVSCNPFGRHSYESCRGVYQQFPFWNSPLITHHWPAVLLKSATSAILESQKLIMIASLQLLPQNATRKRKATP